MDEFDLDRATTNLSRSQSRTLAWLSDGPKTVEALGANIGISAALVDDDIARLLALGHIQVAASQGFELTPSGHALRRDLAQSIAQFEQAMRTDFVLDALEQALFDRQPERSDALIHHSDRGSQYVSILYTERLAQAGIEPSVGSRGDSYDNALAETINGLYKAELIHRRAPWKTKEALELATLEWVAWFNHHRLMEPLGYIPPAEFEANYHRQRAGQAATV